MLVCDVLAAGGVRVVLRLSAIRDDEELHILEEARAGPEAVALVAIDLVERFTNRYPAPLQLDMYHRQAIHQDGDVVPVRERRATLATVDHVLVDDLEPVVVN